MNKTLFHLAFVACVTVTGCATPQRLFSKKSQPLDENLAQQKAKNQAGVPSSGSRPNNPAEVAEFLKKGHAAFQQGLMPEAQTNYQAVLQRQPDHVEANHRLAVIADRQSDFGAAETYYRTAIASAPRDSNILNDLGYSYLLQSRYTEAEQYLSAALRQNPTQANAINNLGVLYAKQGQADRALAQFRRTGSEAEAQAKMSRSLTAIPESAAPTGTMLASNTLSAPQTTLVNNPVPSNATQWANGVMPLFGPADVTQPAQTPSNPLPQNPQSAPNVAPSAINDSSISEATRHSKCDGT